MLIHDGPTGKRNGSIVQWGGMKEGDFWESLQRCKFALHINGANPFSPWLFEAMAAGAVPIIIAPGYVLPFEDILDWRTFSLRVEPQDAGRLFDIIKGIGDDGYQRLAANMAQVSHH